MVKIKYYIIKILSILDYIVPKHKKMIVFSSFPDFSDNAFAMFIYMINKHKNNFQYIWLISENENLDNFKKLINNYNNQEEIVFPKVYKKNTLKGIYFYFRARYVFYTHGMYPGVLIPKNHIVVNLWHGMPLKKIGFLTNDKNNIYTIPKAKYTIATSKMFQEILSNVFHMQTTNVLITGQPRNDFMFEKYEKVDTIILKNFKKTQKMIIWLPTYRKSDVGISINNGISIFNNINIDNFEKLNNILKNQDITLIIKPHPMEKINMSQEYSNIQIVDNNLLNMYGVNLYSLLRHTDVLITDYSSVFIDFLLTKKPIYFYTPDKDIYKNDRGFIYDLFIEPEIDRYVLSSFDELLKVIENYNVCKNIQIKKFEFNEIDCNFSNNVLESLKETINLKQ